MENRSSAIQAYFAHDDFPNKFTPIWECPKKKNLCEQNQEWDFPMFQFIKVDKKLSGANNNAGKIGHCDEGLAEARVLGD